MSPSQQQQPSTKNNTNMKSIETNQPLIILYNDFIFKQFLKHLLRAMPRGCLKNIFHSFI